MLRMAHRSFETNSNAAMYEETNSHYSGNYMADERYKWYEDEWYGETWNYDGS